MGTMVSMSCGLAGRGVVGIGTDSEVGLSAIIASPKLRSATSRLISSLAETLVSRDAKTKRVRACIRIKRPSVSGET